MRVLLSSCVVWLTLAGASAAQSPAEPPPAPAPAGGSAGSSDEREALIDEGLRLREQAQDERALASFERAAALARDGRVLAQISFSEQALGRWAESYLHLRAALADADNPWVKEHAALLQGELAKIANNVGRLDVHINIQVAKLTVDGKEVGITPLSEPIVVTVGSVVVSAQADGYLPTTRTVQVYAGGLSRTELTLVPVMTSSPSMERRAREPALQHNPAWLYIAGAGAAVSLASLAPWLRSSARVDDLGRYCTPSLPTPCSQTPRYQKEHGKVQRLDRLTAGMLASGLSVVALSIVAYFLLPRAEQRRTTIAPSASLVPGRYVILGAELSHRF